LEIFLPSFFTENAPSGEVGTFWYPVESAPGEERMLSNARTGRAMNCPS